MKNGIIILGSFLFLISCGSNKTVANRQNSYKKKTSKTEDSRNLESKFLGKNSKTVNKILKDAEKYLGTPYKFAGNTSSGFDCSGLVCKVFSENNKQLPRRSSDQAAQGKPIDIREIQPGDLLFFATTGGNKVSHVAIVHTINSHGEITFIHASTSKGVIISSLDEKYWNKAFLFARRVL